MGMIKTIAFVFVGIFLVIAALFVTRSSKKTQTSPSNVKTQKTVAPTQAPAATITTVNTPTTPSKTAAPPEKEVSLVVSSPINGSTVTSPSITVKGTTAPRSDVYVNDKDAVADAKGNFSILISLNEGENFLMVTVVDPDGNTTEKEITVTYDAGQ